MRCSSASARRRLAVLRRRCEPAPDPEWQGCRAAAGHYPAKVTQIRVRRGRLAVAMAVPVLFAALALAGWAGGRHLADAAGDASPRAGADALSSASPRPTSTASLPPQPISAPLSAAQQRQVDYALQHWKSYNSAVYGDDNPNGGDCANFVSQTLLQRGWKMNSAWYNNGPGRMSSAWAYVPAMQSYFTANSAALGLQSLGAADRAQYAVGDVVVFWWRDASGGYPTAPDHVQVIDRITGTGAGAKVEMASHNVDYDYRDLDDEVTVEHPGARFVVWHLTRDTN
jgi:hypothetical protein